MIGREEVDAAVAWIALAIMFFFAMLLGGCQ